jgi:NADH:ubiquinone oxidoreductase subunit H
MYIEDIIAYVIFSLLGLVVVLGGFSFYKSYNSPTFSLIKSEWTCTKSHLVTTHVLINKVLMPQIRSECDQWSRNM